MKLRIEGNTLRLRLKRTEIDTLQSDGRVEAAVDFGAGGRLVYALEAADVPHLAVRYRPGEIVVTVPAAQATRWAGSEEEVGMDAAHALDDGGTLSILVEKDFQCLHRPLTEADRDAFRNPQAT